MMRSARARHPNELPGWGPWALAWWQHPRVREQTRRLGDSSRGVRDFIQTKCTNTTTTTKHYYRAGTWCVVFTPTTV